MVSKSAPVQVVKIQFSAENAPPALKLTVMVSVDSAEPVTDSAASMKPTPNWSALNSAASELPAVSGLKASSEKLLKVATEKSQTWGPTPVPSSCRVLTPSEPSKLSPASMVPGRNTKVSSLTVPNMLSGPIVALKIAMLAPQQLAQSCVQYGGHRSRSFCK